MPPTDEEIERVARMAMAEELRPLVSELAAMASGGLSFQSLLLQVIAPAADWLGERWADDELTFSEVTVGAGVLERVAAALGEDSDPPLRNGELVVLTAAPGEQHLLPIHLLGELLRAEGWAVYVDPGLDEEQLIELVTNDKVAAVGCTCKDVSRISYFAELVDKVRATTGADDLRFIIGGAKALALRAPRFGAVYCERLEDFLPLLGAAPRRRISGLHPSSPDETEAEPSAEQPARVKGN